ncbi:serine/threonine protein kinase [Spirosoma endbachense]|uniref:non-specific serine/threonine protein kinase n=1 Tax=Spirosoma endbachense TaxID=2666025 RepID=A0A6P1W146_9BACT|nr:serine/threonine-protein kinase [Spirosoma endbachense]QHV97709.1 protein kinase [Spirosoma endbachense]
MTTTTLSMKGRFIHHYRIESLLGEGGMGTVYRALDTHLERPVAVKMLHSHLVSQVSFMERFRNEALILARLNHPNIAVVYNFLQDGTDYFMAMEYVEGDSLEMLIRKTGALPAAVAAEITRQGLEGLAHAHRKGVLHRDIKPANLMITPEGAIKLMDFGIARVVGEQRMTQANRVVGTLEYMAPELIQGEAPSPASDLYAMGILLYELLSGKLPFASRTDYELMQTIIREKPIGLRKLNAQIPKELEAVVQKALEKNPAKRFADAREFQKALQPFFSQSPALNPAQLTSAPPVKDVMDFQPARRKSLPETKVAPSTNRSFSNRHLPVSGWLAENWQMVLAGGLTALALFFISLILFDQTTDTKLTSPNQPAVKHPAVAANQPKRSIDEPVSDNPQASFTPASPVKPAEVKTVPVEKKSNPTEKTPKVSTPKSPVSKVPVSRKPVLITPETPAQKPIEEPVNQPVAPVRSEPVPELTVPKTIAHKSIAIRRLKVNLTLTEGLSSDGAHEGQSIRFRVTEPVLSDGQVVIQAGATAYGEVSQVKRADGDIFRKKNLLEFRINSVEAINGKRLLLRSATISDEAKGQPVLFRPGQTFEVRTGDDVLNF